MAIDTEEKRKSYLGIVTPNSSKDEEWRREIIGLYPFQESGTPSGDITFNFVLNIGFSIGI